MLLTKTEEDYLKALFHLIAEQGSEKAGTNQLAEFLGLAPASVNNMLKKLKAKDLVDYEKYGKLSLTEPGKTMAVHLIRKHRLWETFLYQYMNFSWDEVHEVAEQLEHIQSPKLISELDRFMGFPRRDPHGAVIPDAHGTYETPPRLTLASLPAGTVCRLVSVRDSSVAFLQYVSRLGLSLSSRIAVTEVREFDGSMAIEVGGSSYSVSREFAENVFVEALHKEQKL